MNNISDPRLTTADASPSTADGTLSIHTALSLTGLPMAPEATNWRRVVPEAEISLIASADLPLPSGRWLRRLLMYICDTALRDASTLVDLAPDLATLATRLGATAADMDAVATECDRLFNAKVAIGFGGGAALSLFDARGRPRAQTSEWRGSIRLGTRFLASLEQNHVAVDRVVVGKLSDKPLALDAYCWVAHMLAQGAIAGAEVPLPMTDWEALVATFGAPGQAEADFRPLYEDALREVSAVCPDLSLIVGETGVQVRQSLPRVRPQPAPPTPTPAEPAAPPRTDSRATEEMVLKPRPQPAPIAAAPAPERRPAEPRPIHVERPPVVERAPPPSEPSVRGGGGAIGLKTQLTGLSQVIWLRKGNGQDDLVIEVTPGYRYDADNVTQLALEPIVVQISGGLYQRDFERVSAWAMANRDLIDDVWDGVVTALEDVNERVKKVPAPGWR